MTTNIQSYNKNKPLHTEAFGVQGKREELVLPCVTLEDHERRSVMVYITPMY